MKNLTKLLTLFLLAALLIIPMVDSMACDDCTDIASFQGGLERSYKNLPQGNMFASINNDDTQDKSSSERGGKTFCSICLNTVAGDFHNFKTIFSAIPFVNQTMFIAFLEPAFSINKPPQN